MIWLIAVSQTVMILRSSSILSSVPTEVRSSIASVTTAKLSPLNPSISNRRPQSNDSPTMIRVLVLKLIMIRMYSRVRLVC